MSLWAIVPVKPLRRGKSRLSGVLSEAERSMLNHLLLETTLKTLTSVSEISHVLVVSRDPAALSLARSYHARTVQEDDESSDLNMALKRATIVAQMYSAQALLILPADLPLIQADVIRDFVKMAYPSPSVVIAPDRHMEGTNALLMNPLGMVEYTFGVGSFNRHVEQAKNAGARIEVVKHQSLELDLDLPEDLELLKTIDPSFLFSMLKS
jgi:2-phospho-L-lactate/phosphoenolpyruvate guanylyltransferase